MAKNKKKDDLFPSEKELERVRKKLSDPSVIGSSVLPPDASPVERAKFKACEMIIQYRKEHDHKQKELAEMLQIDEARMSEILHYKVEKFTLERLVGYVGTLYPKVRLDLSAA
jgi:predicted XRE-type DNA-binding protein